MLARCEAQIEVGTGGRKAVTQVANWKRDSRERPALSIAGGHGDPLPEVRQALGSRSQTAGCEA